ncbi:MAG TPA: zinc ribbon domain-containing protein [Methylomirabilota bacterium]|jgi:hypothetical protein
MTCPNCRTAVPDQSVFCLACGTQLPRALAPRDSNGSGTGAAPAAVSVAPAAPPGSKQPYALSLGPLVDERLRYRVARWVVERAPAHALTEVQDDLQRGTFVTFLALTSEEAESARQGIEQLGVASALLRLAPATTAEMLLPARQARPAAGEKRATGLGDWRTLAAAAVGLLIFGLVVVRLIGGRGF